MAIIAFTIDDTELNFGDVAICGDFSIDIEGDGHFFEVTHVWVRGKRADAWLVDQVKEWASADVLAKQSRVRREFEDAEIEASSPDAVAAARFDHERSERRAS